MITLTQLLIGLGIVLFLAILIIFPKSRVLFKGFGNLFIENVAKTPEGAAAAFSEAIEKAQDDYNKANNTLQKVAGQLDTAQKQLKQLETELKQTETNCEEFAKKNLWDKVEILAQKREEITSDIAIAKTLIANLGPAVEEAKKINLHCEDKLKKLKKEKQQTVQDMKMNQQLKEVYDDMDELKNTTHTDKLISSVREGVKESREQAVGAKVVHNNKLSTKVENIERDAAALRSSSYADELKKKYQK